MRIGIDFDNTIVCYDELFHLAATQRGLLSHDVPVNKSAVRDHLRSVGREDDWTLLQGIVYGQRMLEAVPFPGVLAFFQQCVEHGIEIYIVSHKTRFPVRGPQIDLHEASENWLEYYGFYDEARTGLSRQRVFFEPTKHAKLDRIALLGCESFMDDLPELLAEADFPTNVMKILFDPARQYAQSPGVRIVSGWGDALQLIVRRSVA